MDHLYLMTASYHPTQLINLPIQGIPMNLQIHLHALHQNHQYQIILWLH